MQTATCTDSDVGLKLDLRIGETLTMQGSGQAKITLVSKSGQLARLRIEADEKIKIAPPQQDRRHP